MTTPEQERERIAGSYFGMSDEELEKVAATGYELSEIARQALELEISRRGSSIAIAASPGYDVYEINETVTVRKFRDLPEALLAKGGLESAGIEAYLFDDNMVRMDWFYSNLIGGIKLKVNREDVETANEILNQPIPDRLEVTGLGNYQQPTCPQCHSLDVSYRERLRGLVAEQDALLWSCRACGKEWEESEAADPPEHDPTSL